MRPLVITVGALIVGAVLAIPFLLWTRSQPDAGMRFYALGLGVTALIYVVFALIGGASGRSLGLEAIGVLLYGGAAWLGFRSAPSCSRSAGRCTPSGTWRSTSRAWARDTRRTGIRGGASVST